jgi:hypothetical protein
LVGGISPNGSQLAIIKERDSYAIAMTYDTALGKITAFCVVDWNLLSRPLEVRFESENKFYSRHDTYRVPFVITPTSSLSHSITCGERQPLDELQQRHFDVDNAHEWVVRSSKRICWIPPGYVGLHHFSYVWDGDVLIMGGQDGMVRKLTFRKLY